MAKRPRNRGGALLTAMTNIAAWCLRDRDRLGLVRRRLDGEPSGLQHLLDARDQFLQYRLLSEDVPAAASDFAHGVQCVRRGSPLGVACHAHGHGYDRFKLVDVGDVIDEGLRFAGVQKPYCGCVSCCQDGCLGQSVEACGGLTEAPVRKVGPAPIAGVVLAPLPLHAVLLRQNLV